MLKKTNGLFFGLIIIGIFLRLYLLAKHDLWFDEVLTAINHFHYLPFFPSIIWVCTKILGTTEMTLRLPSALFSIGTLFAAYALAKRLFDKTAALFALTITALSPFHLWYAQEARDYSLTLFLGTLSSYFLVRWLKERNVAAAICYNLTCILGLLTSYPFSLLFLWQMVLVLIMGKQEAKKNVAVFSAPFVFLLLGIFFAFKHIILFKSGFWIPVPELSSLLITLEIFMLGYNGSDILFVINAFIISLSLSLLLIRLRKEKADLWELGFCLAIALLPVLSVFLFSRCFFSIYLDRSFLAFTPYFYMLLGYAINRVKIIPLKYLLLLTLILSMGTGAFRYFKDLMYLPNDTRYHMGTYIKKPIKPLARYLYRNISEKDCIIFAHLGALIPTYYYLKLSQKQLSTLFLYTFDPKIKDTVWQRHPGTVAYYKQFKFFIPKNRLLNIIKSKYGKVFLVGCNWGRDGNLDENSQSIKNYLDSLLIEKGMLDFDGIKLFVYVIPESVVSRR